MPIARYIYDGQRNYLQHPLGINYKVLPEVAAKSGDIQSVLMTIASVGNRECTFQQLQPVYEHVRGMPNVSKINAAIVHANSQVRSLGCGIVHPDGHHCLTPNAHLVCTKSTKATNSDKNTIVVYIDDSLFAFFHDGSDIKYPGMEIVKKPPRVTTKSSEKKRLGERQSTRKERTRSATEKKKNDVVRDFADEIMVESISISRNDVSPNRRSSPLRTRSPRTHFYTDSQQTSLHRGAEQCSDPFLSCPSSFDVDIFGGYNMPPFESLDGIDDIDNVNIEEDDARCEEECGEQDNCYDDDGGDDDGGDDDGNQNMSNDTPLTEQQQLVSRNVTLSEHLGYAPVLDFMEAIDDFFAEEQADNTGLFPLFTEDIMRPVESTELASMDFDLLNILDDFNNTNTSTSNNYGLYPPFMPFPMHPYSFYPPMQSLPPLRSLHSTPNFPLATDQPLRLRQQQQQWLLPPPTASSQQTQHHQQQWLPQPLQLSQQQQWLPQPLQLSQQQQWQPTSTQQSFLECLQSDGNVDYSSNSSSSAFPSIEHLLQPFTP